MRISNTRKWANICACVILAALTRSGFSQETENSHGLVMTEWAREPLVAAPVAIDFDNEGRAYVTVTRRRSTASLDIRRLRDWVKKDLSFTSVDERRAHYMEALSSERSELNPWLRDFNKDGVSDWRDLTAIPDAVYLLADEDGDGQAEKRWVVDGEINSEVSGIAAGVMHHQGALYVTAEPDVFMYSDSDDDGIPDKRTLIGTGYQVHIGQGGHNMSGLNYGPDGRVYWSIGDKGFNTTTKEGNHYYYPNRGAVMRCEPDGSNVEVFALGVRNAQELAFDDFGNLFSVDNDGDYPGERERLLYITEGSEHGWRLNWQWVKMQDFAERGKLTAYLPWMEEKMFKPYFHGQPAHITPTLENYSDGPCGFVYNPGTALNPSLKGCFFLTEFQPKVAYFRMEASGASYRKVDVGILKGGVSNTGLAVGPDGALYSGGWMKGYEVLPEGRIFKIDDPKEAGSPLRLETARLLREGMGGRTLGELSGLLSHADQRVRSKAQFELARRGATGRGVLERAALTGEDLLKRVHGIWGVGQFARKDPEVLRPLLGLIGDSEMEVRAQMCRVIGDAAFEPALDGLIGLLKDESLRVRFLASIALGALEKVESFDAIAEMLVENDDRDIYLRHAGVMGLAGAVVNDSDRLLEFVDHDSMPLRLAAVLALRRHANPNVVSYLKDGDAYVVTEAARAIHDDFSIEGALPGLAALLGATPVREEALVRRLINANFRLGTAEALRRIARFAADETADPLMRRVALTCLEMWEKPGVLDAVEGRYRDLGERPGSENRRLLVEVVSKFGEQTDSSLLSHAARMARGLNEKSVSQKLYEWNQYAGEDFDLKWEILKTLIAFEDEKYGSVAAEAVASSDPRLRELGRVALGKADGFSEYDIALQALAEGTVKEKQEAVRNLGALRTEAADKQLSDLLRKLKSGKHDQGIGLDVFEAGMARSESEILKNSLRSLEKASLDEWSFLENGGDTKRGEALVMGHPIAQCIRCHTLNGTGGILGPDLNGTIEKASRSFLVESLLYPTAEIADGFGIISGALNDGSEFAGLLLEETEDAFVVQGSDGEGRPYAKEKVARHTYASSMPAMKGLLSPGEIRDIVAYLYSLKGE